MSYSNYRFSLIEITLDQSEDSSRISRRYSNPHRYSYYLGKGIAYYTPNKYLNEYGRVISVEDLRNRFSVEVLTKAFYQELSDWYAWAIMIVRFPNDLKTLEDNQKYNSEAMIRLITRLIFVWFLKQRHLVPDEFFDEQFIANELIKGFTPHAIENLFGKILVKVFENLEISEDAFMEVITHDEKFRNKNLTWIWEQRNEDRLLKYYHQMNRERREFALEQMKALAELKKV